MVRLRKHADPDFVLCVLGRLLVVPDFSWSPPHGTVVSALPFHGTRGPVWPLTLATALFPRSVAWAEQGEDGQVRVIEATSSGNKPMAIVATHPDPEVRFGFALPRSAGWGAVGVAWDDTHYSVAAPERAPTTQRIVGKVVGVCVRDGLPGFLTQPAPDRLALVVDGHKEPLPAAAAPIVGVAVCPSQPRVAWVTEEGEIVVYSVQQRAILFRRKPEKPS